MCRNVRLCRNQTVDHPPRVRKGLSVTVLRAFARAAGAGVSPTVPLPATRVADTRYSLNLTGPFSAGQTRTIQIADFWPAPVVPGNAIAVVVNVTAVNATATTFLRVGPTTANDTSTVNVQPGAAASNHSIVALNSNGDIQIYNYAGTVDVIVDLEGYLYG